MKMKILFVFIFFIIASPTTVWVIYLADKEYRLTAFEQLAKFVKVDKGKLQYQIKGEGEPLILFIHGTPGGFDNTFELENHSVLLVSRPGYLGSDLKVGKTPSAQAKAFSDVLKKLEIGSVVVVAVSGGGPSALVFARDFPEQTKALILVSGISQGAPEKQAKVMPLFETDFLSWLFIYSMQGLNIEQVLAPIMPSEENRRLIKEDPKKIEQTYQALWAFWPVTQRQEGQANDWKQFQKLDGVRDTYKSINVPSLIIHGDNDLNVSVDQSKALANQIPDARLEIIEGADHFMMISHSELIKAMINNFLSELDNKNNLEPDAITY